MGGFFTIWCSSSVLGRGLSFGWIGVFLSIWLGLATTAYPADRASLLGPAALSKNRAARPASPAISVGDVVLRDGVLYGVVVLDPAVQGDEKAAASLRVSLMRDGKVVAETKTDQAGRFAVSHLRGGKYVLVVTCGGRVEWRCYRVWTPEAAPPKASTVARVIPGEGIVRGQGPLPAVSFSEAALMAGVVAGAVAAPVIYHNAQKSNRVPASP